MTKVACAKALTILVLAAGIPTTSSAQWYFEGEAEVGLDRKGNVFFSPSRLFSDEGMIAPDSLIRNDISVPYVLDLKASSGKYARGHRASVRVKSENDRHSKFSSLTKRTQEIVGAYAYRKRNVATFKLDAGIGHRNTVGSNILGDELSIAFEYNQFVVQPNFDIDISDNSEIRIDYRYRIRDYGDAGTNSLSNRDARVRAIYYHKYESKNSVSASISYRTKKYRTYLSRDLSGDQSVANPRNQLMYYEGEITQRTYFSDNIRLTTNISGSRRADGFLGYYDNGSIAVRTGVDASLGNMDIAVDASWRRVNFFNKKNSIDGFSTEPNLTYSYYRFGVDLSLPLGKRSSTYFQLESNIRDSNVTDVSRLTRRSYSAYLFGLGIRTRFDSRGQ